MALEKLVAEDVLLFPADFVEVVHVELTNKTGKVFVPKVDGQNVLFELFNVLDIEAQAVVAPRNKLRMFLFLNGKSAYTSRIS